jgi:predicted DNA-binding protein with PD1-like motif
VESRFWQAQEGRTFVGRLATGSDLVEEIQAFCAAENIRAAWVSLVGAVTSATFGYYEQTEHRYIEITSEFHHEISGFIGNVSMRDGEPFLHAHATFAEREGGALGGHLLPGCTVFVGEVQIRVMTGVDLVRSPDELTGLALW